MEIRLSTALTNPSHRPLRIRPWFLLGATSAAK